MAGYPPGPGYSYGAPSAPPYTAAPQNYGNEPSQPYGAVQQQSYGGTPQQPYGTAPYQTYGLGGPAPSAPYAKPEKPGKAHVGGAPPQPYGGAPPQSYEAAPSQTYSYGGPAPSAPYGKPEKPEKAHGGGGGGYEKPPAYGVASPFAALLPSVFPPGTDPNVVACFQMADQDGSGLIDDKELQRALSSYNQSFSIRTVQLLMYLFTSSNARRIGPREFISLFYSLQSWRVIFERFDRDRSGKIDESELREALRSLGYVVSPSVLDLLLCKFDKSGGKSNGIEYDNFIECCLTVEGLTEKFKEKDPMYTGSATFSYESFMLTVLPFLIA
ncbi:probable calcium-binding protein CML50 [Dendrobium catenatum]|uniref:Putative calcium-binding protein CML49 n=1 Tax=Dendrobium catenatum TaxID=906689 RepID=A0A2I0WT65_9ASPA|nr:probable calcium-binding protein CML50 [Dendrobium catenatum]PKU78846.1 putative calcium-binding protein CML49 [Dendrobium catenatum]